jgi:beta-lactamase regulating signal transducer with metallopeptidase domain
MDGPGLLTFAVDALIKTTLVLVAAAAVVHLLRKKAAAWRHMAWTTALAGALVMPAVAWLAPQWTAPIDLPLPLRAAASKMPAATAETEPGALPVGALETAEILTVEKLPPLSTGTLAPAPAAAPRFPPAALLLAAWALGSALLLAWTLRSHLLARALVQRARSIRDPELEALPATTAAGRRVRLVESCEIAVPLATGLMNPVLVVPPGFAAWSVERRRIVLLHELAHVERGDCLALAIARSAVALWWFHPIAWLALASLRREAEQAADDRVLESGTRPSEYASHLLAVVQSLTGRGRATAGLSMAGSHVERRLLAMLDPTRSRSRLSPAALVLCTVVIAGGVVALGGLRADAAPSETAQAHGHHGDHASSAA